MMRRTSTSITDKPNVVADDPSPLASTLPSMPRAAALRRWCVLVLQLVTLACLPTVTSAQGLSVPSSHFGALSFPTPDRIWEAGITLDRYTEHTKGEDSSKAHRMRHYALRSTLGFNLAHITRSFHWRETATIFRAGAMAGYTSDQPTRFFQNNFRHRDAGYSYIGVDDAPSRAHAGMMLAADKWLDVRGLRASWLQHNAAVFIGMEGAWTSVHDEITVQGGLRMTQLRIAGGAWPTLSVMARKSVYVNPSAAYREAQWDVDSIETAHDLIANGYSSSTLAFRLPLDQWFRPGTLVPAVEVGLTNSSGFYMAKRDTLAASSFERTPEKFYTISLQWSDGDFAIETYNDARGEKDLGPSYGARIYTRWRTWKWQQ